MYNMPELSDSTTVKPKKQQKTLLGCTTHYQTKIGISWNTLNLFFLAEKHATPSLQIKIHQGDSKGGLCFFLGFGH